MDFKSIPFPSISEVSATLRYFFTEQVLLSDFSDSTAQTVYGRFQLCSACCPDTQAYWIRRFSEPLYYTADLTATFCGNIIMRIRLPLTVSVFPDNDCSFLEVICQKVSHLTNARHTRIPSTLTKRSSLGYL